MHSNVLFLMILLFCGKGFALEPYPEQYVLEPFIGSCGGGPSSGIAIYNKSGIDKVCSDTNGNSYGVTEDAIIMMDSKGLVYRIGGLAYGFYNGKATDAAYKVGETGYYGAWNMSCSPKGDLFIDDGANKCIRRVFKTDSCWMTETWAGGGTGVLANIGDSAPAKSIDISTSIVGECNSRGEVIIHTGYQKKIYKVSSDGSMIHYLANEPTGDDRSLLSSTTVSGAADTLGNVYFLNRGPQTIYRVSKDGKTQVLCGTHGSLQHDTLSLYRYIWMPMYIEASPDGSCVYVSGGDTDYIIRVPTDTLQSTASLGRNGRFYSTTTQITPDRYTRSMDSTLSGPLKPEGTLGIFLCNELLGRDCYGNLYVGLHPWYAYAYDGISTRIAKLRKVR